LEQFKLKQLEFQQFKLKQLEFWRWQQRWWRLEFKLVKGAQRICAPFRSRKLR
jgi:hypothetical protein